MPFKITKTPLEGLLIIEPQKFGDSRGFFMESYKKSDFIEVGITEEFIQDNHSSSQKGVLRGIHFQKEPMAQAKLVRVTRGAVWDVAVDFRKNSPTYGQWYGATLSEENNRMLYIPTGFGHGFLTLEEDTHFLYKCSNEYSHKDEGGIIWSDPTIDIKWPQVDREYTISEKDTTLPTLKELGEFSL